jgi:hypothetical protein
VAVDRGREALEVVVQEEDVDELPAVRAPGREVPRQRDQGAQRGREDQHPAGRTRRSTPRGRA